MTKLITLSAVVALAIGATSSWAEESARVDFPDAETQQKLNKKWEHALPFHAQKAIDLGYALPLPLSLSFIGNASAQNIEMYDLGVQVGDVNLGDRYDLSQVSFGDPEIESKACSRALRLGCFLPTNGRTCWAFLGWYTINSRNTDLTL